MKYAEMFRFGAEALERAGVGEAELDARLLIEAVCHTSRNDLLVHGDREITEEQEQQYREWIALRASRIALEDSFSTRYGQKKSFHVALKARIAPVARTDLDRGATI